LNQELNKNQNQTSQLSNLNKHIIGGRRRGLVVKADGS
jgi:hypothetical protein